MKKVMVFGTFDGIHLGHLNFLKQAKKHGDYLIVVVARDKTVLETKGKKPRQSEKKRLEEIKKIKLVDEAVFGGLKNKFQIIFDLKPEVICLGYDQQSFTKGLEKNFPAIKIIRLKPYRANKYKSSKLNSNNK